MADDLDVLGLGSVALDDVLYVDAFPEPDTKLRMIRREERFGGLVGGALIAAARLGARCAYAGCLGLDERSLKVARNLEREGVDTSHAPRLEAAGVGASTIVVGVRTKTRNVFSQPLALSGAHEFLPAAEVIAAARVLLVDHHGVPGAIRAATVARQAGRAVVADFERDEMPRFGELLALVDHLILPEGFACRLTGAQTAGDAARRLWREDRQVVVVTAGAAGCWYVSGEQREPKHQPAIAVASADTTGCGDVFHGAYAAALAEGQRLRARLEFASAAAALNSVVRPDGVGAPSRAELERFCAAGQAWSA